MISPPHVCIVTTAHPLDDVRVHHKVGQSLKEAGFRVTWVGPDYAFFDQECRARNHYQYRLFKRRRGIPGRIAACRTVSALAARVPDVDAYYAPDPDSAAVAVRVARRIGARVIFDVHEMYHEAMLQRWVGEKLGRLLGRAVVAQISRTCSRSDLVMGVSASVVEPYSRTQTEKMVVRSFAPSWFARDRAADVCGPARARFTLMHGKSNLQRGTGLVLEAARLARREVPNLRFVMLSNFIEAENFTGEDFAARVAEFELRDEIDLQPGVPMEAMPAILRQCDVGLIAYGRSLGEDSLPNRLFEYMAAGLAIMAPTYAREIARIVESEGCGLLVDFEKPETVAAGIVYLRNRPEECRAMGRRAREAFLKRYNWQVEIQPVLERIRRWHRQGPRGGTHRGEAESKC